MFKRQTAEKSARELTRLFQEKAIGQKDCAHLAVDIQKIYADKNIAQHIAKRITPAFRRASIPNYWIHFSTYTDKNGNPTGEDAFCKVKPLPGETVIEKNKASAFEGSNIDTLLKQAQTKLVAITGFAFGCCVMETAIDARKPQYGYETIILTDGVSPDRTTKKKLAAHGVIFTSSRNFFKALNAAKPKAG